MKPETEAEARARRGQAGDEWADECKWLSGQNHHNTVADFVAGAEYGERHATRVALEQARGLVCMWCRDGVEAKGPDKDEHYVEQRRVDGTTVVHRFACRAGSITRALEALDG